MQTLFQDLRLTARGMRKSPAFTLVAISSLALGIGANTAIFSFVNAILLKRLPVAEPTRLVQLHEFQGNKNVSDGFSYPFIHELAARNRTFDNLLGRFPVRVNLMSGGVAEPLRGEVITGQYFTTLGIRPALGRLIAEEDVRAAAGNPVCVLSYSTWQERFGGDPSIVGRMLSLNSHLYRVVGVTQKGFYGAQLQSRTEIQLPASRVGDFMGGLFSGSKGITWDSPGFSWLQPLGRLKPELTTPRAEAMLQPLVRQIKIELADPGSRNTVASQTSRLHLLDGSQGFNFGRSEFGQPVSVLMGVAGLVLLIACANVANLLLARANVREREFAIRLSLGASRARLIRQLMVESLAIAGCSGALGLFLSVWIVDTLLLYLSPTESLHVSIDPLVICFSAAVSLLTAILFGLAPAWQSSRADLLPGLKDASSTATLRTSRTFFRKAVVVLQVALSLVILFAAGLLTRTLAALHTVDLGFQPANIIALSVDPAMSGYPPGEIDPLYDEILRRIAAGPEVASASLAVTSPLEGSLITLAVEVPGHLKKKSETDPAFNMVSPRYFTTLNQPFLLGRDFSDRDVKGAPAVAIVNERFVQQYMPGQNPLGRHFKQGGGAIEIIGIVKNARFQELREAPLPIVYLPAKQAQSSGYTLLVKARGNPERVIAAIKRTVHIVNSNLPIYNVRTLQAQINEGISSERVLSFLSTLFSALATLLCGIGLYGIVAYSVSRRTREIGVRFAVGAQKSDVSRLFLRESILLIAAGIGIGIPVALAFTRVLRNLLYGLEPTDLLTLALTTAVLGIAGLLATVLPIRRAAGIEPREALKYE